MASERSHRWPIASCFLENSAGSSSSKDAKKAQAFYGEVLGWKVQPFPMGDSTYEMIYAASGATRVIPRRAGAPRWLVLE